jgi:hypothetical protein
MSSTEGTAKMAESSQSLGAQRVRESFNPSKDSTVDKIKRYTADLIDLCLEVKQKDNQPETARLCALAMTAYEEAAMWAVKLVTTKK